MPRAMWKGAISFGLVTIPVAVYPATEERSLRFHQLHGKDGGRIRYRRVCSTCGEEVPLEEIVKGYEYEKDRYVTLTEDELAAVPVESSRTIAIERFVDLEEIDPIYFKKSYYLVPEEVGARAYALLREAMSRDGKVGIAKVSFRDKEHLATLRFRGKAFVLETMFWPDEIREAEGVDVEVKARPQEIEMARQLIESLSGPFEPAAYRDEYREKLLEIVERKVAGEEITVAAAPPASEPVVDLMEALKRSVAAAKERAKPAARPRKAASRKKAAAG
ncbi:MAG TPA: Ku protein [Actinomycetota bacterium]|nr:Ku protein [Actinomycetota bacterium]